MSIDLTGPHPRTPRGSVFILTCTDVFSKWTEAFPLPNKEAATVARVLVEQVFCRIGTPICLLSDNGNEVDSSIMRQICQLLNIDKIHTTFYKPSTNAAIERFHRTLNSMIGKVVSEKQTDWDLWLPYIMAAYRNSRHDVTNFTPNYLIFGREVRAPVDIVLGTGENQQSNNSYDSFVDTTHKRMCEAYDLVRQHIGESAQRNKRYYDVRVRPAQYKVGQWVFYFNPRRFQGRQEKWSRKYTGPFCVTKVLGPVNVQLQRSRNAKPFVAHLDKIKPYLGPEPKGWIGYEPINGVEPNINGESSAVLEEPAQVASPAEVDVITFTEDQEFRRTRPRRQVQRPLRFSD
jgi:transposase InsO family protein